MASQVSSSCTRDRTEVCGPSCAYAALGVFSRSTCGPTDSNQGVSAVVAFQTRAGAPVHGSASRASFTRHGFHDGSGLAPANEGRGFFEGPALRLTPKDA